jgi:hypothetical protein
VENPLVIFAVRRLVTIWEEDIKFNLKELYSGVER